MADEIIVDMVPQPEKPSFFRSRAWYIILAFLILILIAALASWWLARGRLVSVSATVDAMVYTVEPSVRARVEKVFAGPGDLVRPGQALARIDYQANGAAPIPTQDFVGAKPAPTISDRLIAAQQAEREMAARVNQAREEEDKLRFVYQEMVTDHARAQLRMRSINPNNRAAYAQAAAREEEAKANAQRARDAFEQYSRMRAAQDAELRKIRAELQRYRQRAAAPAPIPAHVAPELVENDLFAPVAGKILKVLVTPGLVVAPDQPLFVILPTQANQSTGYWIQAWFPKNSIGDIAPGQKVDIRVENRGLNIAGKVVSVSDEAQIAPVSPDNSVTIASLNKEDKNRFNSTRYLPVRVGLDFPSDGAILEPGSKVTCLIQTRSIPGLGFLE